VETITSRKNPLVLLMRRVAQGDADERGRLLLDGLHLVQEARAAGVSLSTAAFSTRLLAAPDGHARRLATTLAGLGCRVAQVSDPVMEAMSPTAAPSGVVALAARPRHELASLLPPITKDPFLCVAIDVQDPGNVGAIVRVAEAGGAAGVIVAGASADPYGWKALRGSMGSALRLPIVREAEAMEVVRTLQRAGVRVLATAPGGRESFADQTLTGACACLLGAEGSGLHADLVSAADGLLTIPMEPPVESLNVAVSAALIVYEARRQRLMRPVRAPLFERTSP
jgi:RNA methyltransferase, TrmH family